MIKFKFELDEFNLSLIQDETFPPLPPFETYYKWMPDGSFELVIDGKTAPDVFRPCPIIHLAAQLRFCMQNIEIGETIEICFMDDGGGTRVSRPSEDSISAENFNPVFPPVSCNFYELIDSAGLSCHSGEGLKIPFSAKQTLYN